MRTLLCAGIKNAFDATGGGREGHISYRFLYHPTATKGVNHVGGSIDCKERLGELLKNYDREAACDFRPNGVSYR
jgi:hypothetical protein